MQQLKVRNIIFDLDGTLVDSAGDIIDCLNKAYQVLPSFTDVKIDRSHIGPPLHHMVKLITPVISQEEIDKVIEEFRTYYDKSTYFKTIPYEGVHDLIRSLHKDDIKMFIATNKPFVPTKLILKKIGDENFSDVITPDIFPRKKLEKTEMLSFLIDKWSLQRETSVMVGDSASDISAAKNNGLTSIAVSYGYGDIRDICASNPDYVIEKIDSLYSLLSKSHKGENR